MECFGFCNWLFLWCWVPWFNKLPPVQFWTKPLPEPMLTHTYICCHIPLLSHQWVKRLQTMDYEEKTVIKPSYTYNGNSYIHDVMFLPKQSADGNIRCIIISQLKCPWLEWVGKQFYKSRKSVWTTSLELNWVGKKTSAKMTVIWSD